MTETSTIGIACLGVTHPHASGRVRFMLGARDVRVVGASDDDPVIEPFCRMLGVPRRTTDELLADDSVHAVLAHGKSYELTPLAIRALEAGKAVLVEKPGGANVEDLERLTAAVEATGGICQVGYNYRFSPAVDITGQALSEQWLGEVLQVRAHAASSLDEAATSHLNQPADMGGAFFVIGSHMVDLLLAHFGVPLSVNARMPRFGDRPYQEDAAVAMLNYPDRIVSIDFFSWDAMPWIESWQLDLHGTNGSLYVHTLPTAYRLYLKQAAGGHLSGWSSWAETGFPTPWAADVTEYSPEPSRSMTCPPRSRPAR